MTSAASDDVQVIVAPLTAPVVINGRFSVVRAVSEIASRSADRSGAFTTTSKVIVVPSDVVAVSVTGASPVRVLRETTPVFETTAVLELAHVRVIPLADAGKPRFFVTCRATGWRRGRSTGCRDG